MYSIKFTVTKKKFCLSLHYNGANSYLCVNGKEIIKFKAEDSEIVASPRTNKTRHIKWHETCKCKCRLNASVCNNKQRWNNDKCQCECKELIDKRICDKGYIWNPSNWKCECDKSCDFGEYLDYENCKCRKRLVDKLIGECNENINEEVKILDKSEDICSSCILYIVLFPIFFTINIEIATYFIYYNYITHNEENVSKYDYLYQRRI